MRRVLTLFLAGCLIMMILNMPVVMAEQAPKVLVIFSAEGELLDEHVRQLDLLLGHFSEDSTFVPVSEVEEAHLKGVTHLFYFGHVKETLPENTARLLENYDGVTMALGYNVEQLGKRYAFVKPKPDGNGLFTRVIFTQQEAKSIRVTAHTIHTFQKDSSAEVLVSATYGDDVKHPLVVRQNENYYYASEDIQGQLTIVLGEVLHEVFQTEHQNLHPAYIRLEDVHPKVDPDKLLAIAQELKRREIPYMIAVIPVYINPETKKEYKLADSPALLNVLQYMQENGGSVVMHGYTHQFRASETGEGFEFWDVENNMPIYHEADEEVVRRTEADFDSAQEYEAYQKQQLDFESAYIERKLTKGIQELANYGIYPLAFEAPHYTMSQNGYKKVAEHFSTYSGQIQTSDENWEIMATAPYMTEPTFLHGMSLLPETLGYVQPNDPLAIEKIGEAITNYSFVRDGMLAGFYHPYLGVEQFIALLDEMEKIPGIEWIDLKARENEVQAPYVTIVSKDGEIRTDINYIGLYTNSSDLLVYRLLTITRNGLFIMVGAGFFAVLMFGIYILNVVRKSTKLISKRRRYVG